MYTDVKLLTMPKKERKYQLMNQYANSIADLSASIEIELPPASEKWASKGGVAQLEGMTEVERETVGVKEDGGLDEINIAWRNVLDAEFARQWPKGVKHTIMGEVKNYTAPPPEIPMEKSKAQTMEMVERKEKKRLAREAKKGKVSPVVLEEVKQIEATA